MKKILILALAILSPVAAFSQQDSSDLYTMSLEELMSMEVTSPSKKAESINDAPGVIVSISQNEIEKFGATNLLDVLERVTGIYCVGTYFIPNNYVSIRGDLSSSYNRHVLILINGRPTRETLYGGVDFSIFESLPLQLVERVEVIRGPGSVLYGSNAFSGVVNVITKSKDESNYHARISGGSFDTQGVEVSSFSKKDNLSITTGFKYLRSAGWEFNAESEEYEAMSRRMGKQAAGAMINLAYKKFTLNTFFSECTQNNIGVLPIIDFPGSSAFTNRTIFSNRLFLDAGYTFDFSDKWQTTVNGTYNDSKVNYDESQGTFEGVSTDFLFEVTNHVSIKDNLNFILGGTAYSMSGGGEINDGGSGVSFTDQTWGSGYFQFQYKPIEIINLIVGGQVNKPAGVDANFVPRGGVIINATKNLGLKVLYGEAFRSPYIAERKAQNPPFLTGNPDLKPETIQTFDAQFFFSSKAFLGSITYFKSTERNLINLTSPPFQTFVNSNRIDFSGVETELKTTVLNNVFLTGSVSYQTNALNDTIDNATFVPQMMGKLAVSYSNDYVSVGIFGSYFSEAFSVSILNPASRELNPKAESFIYLTANVSVDVAKLLFSNQTGYGLKFNLNIANILNEQIYYPEYSRKVINTIPGRPGMGVYGGLVLRF